MKQSRKKIIKEKSAGNRRSKKSSKPFKLRNCRVRVARLKFKKVNMRKVNAIVQKKAISNKKINTIDKKPEIRILKAVSNVSKQIGKDNSKIRNNLSITKQKLSENSEAETSKSQNTKIKLQSQGQKLKYPQKMTRNTPTGGRSDKKTDEKKIIDNKQILKKPNENKTNDETPTRSKRTPVPNRKYLNDNLITSFKKNDKILRKIDVGFSDSESENDHRFNNSSSDVDSDILRDSENDSSTAGDEYGDKRSKIKLRSNQTVSKPQKSTNISPTLKQKLINDAMERNKNKSNQVIKLKQDNKSLPQTLKKTSDSTPPGKTIILNKYSYNQSFQAFSEKKQLSQSILERSQKPKQQILPTNPNVNLIRKRKLNEPIREQRQIVKRPKPNEKSSLKDLFFNDIESNDDDINNTDIDDFIKELTVQKQIKVVKKLSQPVNRKTPINQETRSISTSIKKPTILNKSLPQPKQISTINENKKNNIQQATRKILNKNYETENDSLESDKEISGKNTNPFDKIDGSTLEDFEKMPTFTIVNINDIIGKKGDFLLEKMKNDPLKSEDAFASPDSSDENIASSSKKKIGSSVGYSSSPAATVQRNRRKAMHTNLLSENIDKNKAPPPRTPFPPPRNKSQQQQQSSKNKSGNQSNIKILNNNLKLSKSTSSNKRDISHNKSSNRGPPRILNSMVAKKTTPITTFNTKVDTRRSKDLLSDSDSEKHQIRSKPPSKESISKNQLLKQINENKLETNKNQSIINSSTGIKRKLPSEKVIIQRQGNKIIKKITCFETWYVINLPPETFEKENTIRNLVEIPLIQLANEAKNVDLPNSKWTCKVSLTRCTPLMLSQNDEPYTGEIYDDYIDPDELHKYRPTNVMFRRQALHPTPKVPYDRAVIFKNNTFFTNIEGKNVKLIGAPHQIEQLKDIEILLSLVDEFSLKNQFVEQAPYVP